ncbi:MAG: hypothetical protein MZU91_14860 [Desulfosudis oleivorans]|nr:hypothetical protein [Desulfosudis oleivorans]
MPLIAQAERNEIRRLWNYDEGTAGAVMTTDYCNLPPDMNVKDALESLRLQAPNKETIYQVYLTDGGHHLLGVASLQGHHHVQAPGPAAGHHGGERHCGPPQPGRRIRRRSDPEIRLSRHPRGGRREPAAGDHHGRRRHRHHRGRKHRGFPADFGRGSF